MMLLKKTVIRLSGNGMIQNLLEKNARISQYLMGIGSGGGVLSSGERGIFDILRSRARGPYCIFDVGANKGQFVQLIRDGMEAEPYVVHCFEPGRETFEGLRATCKDDPRVVLNNVGAGKARATATLHYDRAGSGLASLTKRKLDHFGIDFSKTETVEIDTIDHYCSDKSISRIDLLKIDVEGHELDVLSGAQGMLAQRVVDMVTFEFGGCNIDTRTYFQDFWYFFAQRDFDLFRITPSGYLRRIESYGEIHEQFRTMNFIALSNAERGARPTGQTGP